MGISNGKEIYNGFMDDSINFINLLIKKVHATISIKFENLENQQGIFNFI